MSPETRSVSYPFSVRWQVFSSVTFTLTVVLLLLVECFDLSHRRCHKLVFTKLNTRGLSVLAWRQRFRRLRPHCGGTRLITGARVKKDFRPKCHIKQTWNSWCSECSSEDWTPSPLLFLFVLHTQCKKELKYQSERVQLSLVTTLYTYSNIHSDAAH